MKGIYANETVSLKKMGDRAIEVTYKRDGKLYSVEKITVSPDGKKMTHRRRQQANRKSLDAISTRSNSHGGCETPPSLKKGAVHVPH